RNKKPRGREAEKLSLEIFGGREGSLAGAIRRSGADAAASVASRLLASLLLPFWGFAVQRSAICIGRSEGDATNNENAHFITSCACATRRASPEPDATEAARAYSSGNRAADADFPRNRSLTHYQGCELSSPHRNDAH